MLNAPAMGYVMGIASACLSAFAAVYTEYIMNGAGTARRSLGGEAGRLRRSAARRLANGATMASGHAMPCHATQCNARQRKATQGDAKQCAAAWPRPASAKRAAVRPDPRRRQAPDIAGDGRNTVRLESWAHDMTTITWRRWASSSSSSPPRAPSGSGRAPPGGDACCCCSRWPSSAAAPGHARRHATGGRLEPGRRLPAVRPPPTAAK